MIHFDFDDRYQDELVVGSAISKREGVLFSTLLHAVLLGLILFGPEWSFLKPDPAEIEARQQELERIQREREEARRRFVFVQPRVDFEAKTPPPRAELSDINRKAQAPRRAENATNPAPFSRGDSIERTESAPEERARGVETEIPPNTEPPKPEPQEQIAKNLPTANTGLRRETDISRPAPGRLGDALRNLERYVQNQTFNNPQGGANDPGSTIQFDTKGVEFGPWIRRFVAQVRRNWFIPNAAMSFRGRVVIQFNVFRNGHITDVRIVQPSSIEAFNRASYTAITTSNPTEPLPADYPAPAISPMTVTFYYNELPPD
ncbi:MAG TPA: TonB family protein [Vicinamibacterales bacterium]|nr:TonB family protein [Vicinamibacterales bacterium]